MIDVTVARTGSGDGGGRLQRRKRVGGLSRGGVIGWLVLSFLLLSALLVLGGIFFVHTIKVHQSGAGNDVQVETPFGSVHVTHNQGGRPETGGLPIYPGAKPIKDR